MFGAILFNAINTFSECEKKKKNGPTTVQKIFIVHERSLLCSPRLHLFGQK